ncbi:glycosyltransferase family A protein [Kineococcus sp. SYSU DK005]|uniref:glycosyltransferase family A protein n=1 Tax=Kineococcus sp. SYSU DK005 TaxID=3383126 RepID=UPI003D7EE2A6
MLAFITSVRHPRNSADYERVEELLRRTLRSVCRQTVDDHVVVVACNRVPAGRFPSNVRFLRVGFPPPVDTAGPVTGREAVLRDKGTKLAAALVAAQEHRPDHVMKVDADDFVSRRIAEFTARHPGAPGWYVDRGYVVSAETGLVAPCPDFDSRCGTSEVVANDSFRLPADLPAPDTDQDELVERLGTVLVRDLLGSHRAGREHFAALGRPLAPLPFAGAAYLLGTGENHSGLRRVRGGRPVPRRLAAEFGMEHLRTPGAWSCFARERVRAARGRARSLAVRAVRRG